MTRQDGTDIRAEAISILEARNHQPELNAALSGRASRLRIQSGKRGLPTALQEFATVHAE